MVAHSEPRGRAGGAAGLEDLQAGGLCGQGRRQEVAHPALAQNVDLEVPEDRQVLDGAQIAGRVQPERPRAPEPVRDTVPRIKVDRDHVAQPILRRGPGRDPGWGEVHRHVLRSVP